LSDSVVIRFRQVTKYYPRESILSAGLKSLVLNLPQKLHQAAHNGKFCALDRISFEVRQGECLGVIGRNGSGKSTTLGLIAGVLKPSHGTVEAHGHICPLLELGAGFHPDLSGADNIFLNGILLGMTRREINAKLEEITAFSELEGFLEQPLRTYSSGMVARLGFSVAVHLDPQILLVDEILAVGDLAFAQKCHNKMNSFREQGVTIVLVSHGPEAVASICDRALWLDGGRMKALGDAKSVCNQYREAMLC
jgi:homopolymeric O-antigen transport system ATP-binding protein